MDPHTMLALLQAARYHADPVALDNPRIRWVMNLRWYKKVRKAAQTMIRDVTDEEVEEWEPSSKDSLFGIKIHVTEKESFPRLSCAYGSS